VIMAFVAGPEAGRDTPKARAAVAAWSGTRPDAVRTARDTIRAIEASSGGWSFAKLTIANAALRELTLAAR